MEEKRLFNRLLFTRMGSFLTQQALAERVGTSRQTIASIERGISIPSLFLALKIAKALETPLEEIFSLEHLKPFKRKAL